MQFRLWVAVMLLSMGVGVGAGRTDAQTSTQNQASTQNQPATPATAPQGTMDGMDVNAGPDQPHAAENARGMGRAQSKNKLPSSPLRIVFGGKAAAWTLAELAELPHTTLTVFNEHAKASQTYSGVPLMDLLVRVGVPASPHGKAARLYVVGEGADGYEAVFSLAEVNPDVHDGRVIVADALDGKPLGAEGPFKIIVAGDKHPSRWVRSVAAVRVMAAQ